MNSRQVTAMWCGIAAAALPWLVMMPGIIWGSERMMYAVEKFASFQWLLVVALVTGGFIVTFRGGTSTPADMVCGTGRLTLVVSVAVFVLSTFPGMLQIFSAILRGRGPILKNYLQGMVNVVIGGIICFVGVWAIYAVVRWAVVPAVGYVSRGFARRP